MSTDSQGQGDSRRDTEAAKPIEHTIDTPSSPKTRTGQKIGPCTLRRLIGSGGMGTVYEAVQESPRRTVAIKLMRTGLVTPTALRRFEFESQILARLRHPGIAQVYEAGTHHDPDGETPWFIMEYIPGAVPITDYASRNELSIRDRMKLFLQVCQAVQHGHLKGIVHRDLKPGNILIASNGKPKIIDFGVARSTDSDMALTTLQTDIGQILGTLQYMSPEQCAADPNDIDTRSDVYALGVVLHELLAGQVPYDVGAAAIHEAVRIIQEEAPTRLSSINRQLKGDLEVITGKALEKERDRRYQSAAALGADIGHWLDDEPINARPPSALDHLLRFARRHTAAAVAICVIVITLVVAITLTTLSATEAMRQRTIALEAQADQTRQREAAEQVKDFLKDMIANIDPARSGRMAAAGMSDMLEEASARIDGEFAQQPLLQAELRSALGETWTGLGMYDQALTEFQAAHDIHQRVLGKGDYSTLQSMGDLGRAMRRLGSHEQAAAIFERQINGFAQRDAPDSPDLLKARVDLAKVFIDQVRYGDAQALLTAVTNSKAVRDAPASSVGVDAKISMGELQSQQGVLSDAERWLSAALADLDVLSPADPTIRQYVLYNLAIVKARQDLTEEAVSMLQTLLDEQESFLGPDHPDTLATAGTLGGVLANAGDLARAEPLFQRVYQGQLSSLGPLHPATLGTMQNLGNMQIDLGKVEMAHATAQMAMANALRSRGPDDPLTHGLQRLMARVYLARGDFDQARALAQRAVDGAVGVFGEQSGHTTLALDLLIQVYDAMGDEQAALEARDRVQRIIDTQATSE
ncbi:MAG: tetratricopeptide repeat protein [Phycisphaerales bacterium]|nr:tetratricopeptide repeat protein [Phycisphaerales bacterium]